MDPCDYVEKFNGDKYYINLYHGGDCEFDLYEDDGLTYDYLDGAYATTAMELSSVSDNILSFKLGRREGSYDGRAKREGDAYKLSDPVINGMGETPSFRVILHTAAAKSVTLDGKTIDFTTENGKTAFDIPSELHEKNDLEYLIEY